MKGLLIPLRTVGWRWLKIWAFSCLEWALLWCKGNRGDVENLVLKLFNFLISKLSWYQNLAKRIKKVYLCVQCPIWHIPSEWKTHLGGKKFFFSKGSIFIQKLRGKPGYKHYYKFNFTVCSPACFSDRVRVVVVWCFRWRLNSCIMFSEPKLLFGIAKPGLSYRWKIVIQILVRKMKISAPISGIIFRPCIKMWNCWE